MQSKGIELTYDKVIKNIEDGERYKNLDIMEADTFRP